MQYLPQILTCALFIGGSVQALTLGTSLSQVAVVLGSGALAAYFTHQNSKNQIQALKETNAEYEARFDIMDEKIQTITHDINSVKNVHGFKNIQGIK